MARMNAVAGNTTDVSVSNWPKGVYFAEIVGAQTKYARPFIKE